MASGPEILIKIGADTAGAIGGINRVNKALGSKMTGFEKFKAGVDRAFVPAVAALGALGVAAFEATQKAADLAETQNKVGVIFGDSAKDLDAWAKAAPQALGQTEQAALDGAATFAQYGKAAGLAGSDLVGFSTGLVDLSSDIASFQNAEPAEVVAALGSALRGESEPMRKFGVMLDDATLKAEAMALGIYDGTGSLTAQQKVLAAQAAIMKQTTDAQGDFARTSDGAANQQRILKATLEQTQTELGSALLPVLETVVGMLSQFATWARENQGLVKGLAIAIAAVAAVIVVLKAAIAAWTAVQWLLNAAMAANPIGIVVIAIAALVAAVIYAWNNFDWFREAVTAAWEGIQSVIEVVVGWFQDTVWPIIKKVIGFIVAYYQFLWKIVQTVWDGIYAVIETVVKWWQNTAWPIIRKVIDFIKAYYQGLWTAIQTVWSGIQAAIEVVVRWWQNTAWPMIQKVIDLVKQHFQNLGRAIDTIWNAIKTAIRTVWNWLDSNVFSKMRTAISVLQSAFETFKGIVVGVWNGIRDAVASAVAYIIDKINTVKSALSNIPLVGGIFGRSLPAAGAQPIPMTRGLTRTGPSRIGDAITSGAPVVVVNGALDPVAVAKQIKRILNDQNVRLGTVA